MKYRKKPIVIDAMQWTGSNATEVVEWAQGGWRAKTPFDSTLGGIWIRQKVLRESPLECLWFLVIPTLEGDHEASPGDWIIRGVKGELYPCKPDIFEATYDSQEQSAP